MELEGKNLKPTSINLEYLGRFRPSSACFCPEIPPNQEKLEEGEARVGSVKRLEPDGWLVGVGTLSGGTP